VFRITLQPDDSVTILTAEGELDAFVAPDLTAAFEQIDDTSAVVADLTAVSFLDSTALGLIVRAVREISERNGDARIVLPSSAARRIFEITTLDRVLPVEETLAAALESIRRRSR
jgi:anti-sigma B factor antagonist